MFINGVEMIIIDTLQLEAADACGEATVDLGGSEGNHGSAQIQVRCTISLPESIHLTLGTNQPR